jgi:hypothetical protein
MSYGKRVHSQETNSKFPGDAGLGEVHWRGEHGDYAISGLHTVTKEKLQWTR